MKIDEVKVGDLVWIGRAHSTYEEMFEYETFVDECKVAGLGDKFLRDDSSTEEDQYILVETPFPSLSQYVKIPVSKVFTSKEEAITSAYENLYSQLKHELKSYQEKYARVRSEYEKQETKQHCDFITTYDGEE